MAVERPAQAETKSPLGSISALTGPRSPSPLPESEYTRSDYEASHSVKAVEAHHSSRAGPWSRAIALGPWSRACTRGDLWTQPGIPTGVVTEKYQNSTGFTIDASKMGPDIHFFVSSTVPDSNPVHRRVLLRREQIPTVSFPFTDRLGQVGSGRVPSRRTRNLSRGREPQESWRV